MSSSAHAYATFDNDDLCTMHSAYEAACARLNISTENGDPARRERVAVAIIGSAEDGERDLRRLEDSAVLQYLAGSRMPAGANKPRKSESKTVFVQVVVRKDQLRLAIH